MKILQVVHGFPPARRLGTEIYAYVLCKELAKRNEVHVFYPVSQGNRPGLNSFPRENLEIHELKVRSDFLWAISRATDFKSTYKSRHIESEFKRLLDTLRPDIIHFQHLINLSASLLEIAKQRRIPTVVTLHDFWFICPLINLLKPDFSLCGGPDDSGRNCYQCWDRERAQVISNLLSKHHLRFVTPVSILSNIRKVRNPPYLFVERAAYMKSLLLEADRIIAPSRFLMDTFSKYGVPREKIVCIDKGFDFNLLENFDSFRSSQDKHSGKLVLGFVGGIGIYKGFNILIEAFNRLKGEDAELKIYGNYAPLSKEFVDARSRIKNPNVKFMGRYDDVRQPYSEIDVLIFPSICYENRPLVLTESIITRTPVIASNLGSIPELIIDGENGLLYEAGNSQDLYDKIMMFIQHPELLERLKRSPSKIKTIQDEAEELERTYREILHRTI
jgi:glycosyltransferase involved in cell wall biosynthesis